MTDQTWSSGIFSQILTYPDRYGIKHYNSKYMYNQTNNNSPMIQYNKPGRFKNLFLKFFPDN